MSYQVLARKWRPQVFDDVVGQQHITDVLKNMLETGRIHHGYLFSGTRGIGKTTTARILAKSLNCIEGPSPIPCNRCEFCREITKSYSIDVEEIDGASNRGVDDVRLLQDDASYAPSRSRYKVFIIDEVHMLTTEAFNALLKTMEEPPPNVVFILATTEPWKVPLTILSRCQQFKFRKSPSDELMALLKKLAQHEGIAMSDTGLALVAKIANGSVRDAENLLDQVVAFSGEDIHDQDVRYVLGIPDKSLLHETFITLFQHQTARVFSLTEQLVSQGYNLRLFCMELLERVRNMIVLKIARHPDPYLVLFDYSRADLERYALHTTLSELQQWYWLLTVLERDMKYSPQPRFILEMALAKMTDTQALDPLDALSAQLDDLQSMIANVEAESPTSELQPIPKPSPPLQKIPAKPQVVPERSYGPPSQELMNIWNTVVETIKQKRPGLAATLRHAAPLELTQDTLTLGFHPETSFARKRLEDQDKLGIIREALQEHLSRPVQVQTTIYEGAISAQSIKEKLTQPTTARPVPPIPEQPYTPPQSSRTSKPRSQNDAQKGGKSTWKGRGNNQGAQYKPPVHVSVQDVVRLFDGEIEE